MTNKVRIVYNRLLGGWFIVRGPHQTPIGGRFDTRQAALAHLNRKLPVPGAGCGIFEANEEAAVRKIIDQAGGY